MGLLKTAATVAVASSVHGRIQRRQQARWAAQDQALAGTAAPPPYTAPVPPRQAYAEPVPPPAAPAPPPTAAAPSPAPAASAPASMGDRLALLKQLGELLSAGVLSQAEFEQEKARILNG